MSLVPPLRRRSAPATWAQRLAFSALTLALVSGLTEVAFRLAWTPQLHDLHPATQYFQDHPTLFWTLRPGFDSGSSEPVRYRFNSLGLRDDELAMPKPEGLIRILSLGESSTWGHGVEASSTYSEQLQELLNADGGPPRYEVVNAGVGAWTTWQSSVFLEELGGQLEPDWVLIYHERNDSLPQGVRDENNFLVQVRHTDRQLYLLRRPFRGLLGLAYRSQLYLGLRQLLRRLPSDLPEASARPDLQRIGQRVPLQDRRLALERIHDTCQEHGIRLVVIQPVYHGRAEPSPLLRSFAQRHALTYVDLPTLRWVSGLDDEQLFQDPVHPTVQGHRFIAEAIRWTLQEEGMI